MPRFLAIDVDGNGLHVAAANLHRGAVTIEQVASRASPPALSVSTASDLGLAIRELLTQSGIKPAPVLLCVGRDRIIPKEVRHPPTPPADEPAVVRFQGVKELSEAGEDVTMDYVPLPPSTAGERRALAVFVRKEVVAAARTLCESAGLKLAAVTPRPFAAVAGFQNAVRSGQTQPPQSPTAPVALVNIGPAGGEFTVARGSHVGFTRSIPAAAVGNDRLLIAELRRNLTVVAGTPATPPLEAIYVAEGQDPTRESWADRLGDVLPIPVRSFDPFAGSAVAESIPPQLRSGFAGVVGLLAARAASETLPINFATPRQPRAEVSPHRPRILVGVLVAVLILGVGALYGFLEFSKASRRVANANDEKMQIDADLSRAELDAKRLAAADEFSNREVVWLDEVYDLSDRFPDIKKMRVVEIEASALAPPPKAVAKPGAPKIVPKNAKPDPVGQLRVVVTSEEPALVDRLVDAMNRDKFYSSTSKSTSGLSAGSSRAQQFTITTQVLHRAPSQYSRKLQVSPPSKAIAAEFADPPAPAGSEKAESEKPVSVEIIQQPREVTP